MSNFAHVTSKLGSVRPETRSIAQELYEAAQSNGHEIWFMWGMGSSSEHRTGLALDLMVRNKAAGDFLRQYIWTHRARLRLRHVIWWQRITSTVVRPGVIRKMADRGNPTVNHEDHVHVLFYAGAYQAPRGQTNSSPSVSTPSTSGSAVVRRMQQALKVGVDGKWGSQTDRAAMLMRKAARARRGWPKNVNADFDIRAVQAIIGTKVDGVWGGNSQGSLINWVIRFQNTMGVAADGKWGPKTDGKLIQLRNRHHNKF